MADAENSKASVGREYRLVDTKVGVRDTYDSLEAARTALQTWIDLQRGAGEPVHETSEGQWADSRVTVWISGPNPDQVLRLRD